LTSTVKQHYGEQQKTQDKKVIHITDFHFAREQDKGGNQGKQEGYGYNNFCGFDAVHYREGFVIMGEITP